MKKKILFVAMQNSIHTARWIQQIKHENFELHLFLINLSEVHSDLTNIIIHKPIKTFGLNDIKTLFSRKKTIQNFKNKFDYLYPFPLPNIIIRIFHKIQNLFSKNKNSQNAPLHGAKSLAKLIKKLKPDLIHSLEFQNCSYLVLGAKEILKNDFPKWIATNWGSDIYYFQNIPQHKKKIQNLLTEIDFYASECERDVKLAKNLGFQKEVIPVMPNTGGFDLKEISTLRKQIKTSERRYIMIKGYQSFAGRALTALEAITECYDLIQNYTIVFFSTSPLVISKIQTIKKRSNKLNFLLVPDNTPHQEMLKYFAKARIYLGISISDAISTSLLEALALGTFPIQTNTSCCEEWIEHGKTGFSIPHDNLDVIVDCLKQAITDDSLVDKAMHLNWEVVRERLDAEKLKTKTINIYENILMK